MKNCIRPHYEKLKSLKSGFIENSIFENNRDPWLKQYSFSNNAFLSILIIFVDIIFSIHDEQFYLCDLN